MAKKKETGLSSFEELAKSEYAKELGFDYESSKIKDELNEFIKSYKVYEDWESLKDKTSDIRSTLSKLYRWKNVEAKLSEFSNLNQLIHWINESNDIRNEITDKEILFDLWKFDYDKVNNLGDVYILVRREINDLKRELSRKNLNVRYMNILTLWNSTRVTWLRCRKWHQIILHLPAQVGT